MTENATSGDSDRLPAGGAAKDDNAIDGSVDGIDGVAVRTARRTLAGRAAGQSAEVRRLLDEALELMRRGGATSRPRVADIVAAAGMSYDAFYRYFPSKDALVTALVEDGAQRLASYAAHQMGKETEPAAQVRRWVEAILAQAHGGIAETTRAVLWNGSGAGDQAIGRYPGAMSLAKVLRPTAAALGSPVPDLDAALAANATFGILAGHLWARTSPSAAETDHIIGACLRIVSVRLPR